MFLLQSRLILSGLMKQTKQDPLQEPREVNMKVFQYL